jgi:serine/threonine protein kinase
MRENAFPDALPPQSRLHWYVLEQVLGQGGFGITYLARDTNLDQPVAIKEYLPVDVATRRPDGTVRARTSEQHERYHSGLERFIREARTLARFDHPNIVRVHSVFEFNDTAYMVMRFEEGETLASLLERRHVLPESELLRVLMPIVDGLELVHKAGFIHRDIKPDNILIRDDGSSVLLDFGSARHASGQSRTVTILVAPGYAPFEQYYSAAESQGPWTDIYGLGATCYRAIAGRPPLDAIGRSKGILGSTKEILLPAKVAGNGRYSERLLQAVDHALEFAEAARPQTLAEWRNELVGDAAKAPPMPAAAAATAVHHESNQRVQRRGPLLWASGGAAAVIVVLAASPWLASLWRENARAPEPAVAEKAANGEASDALRERLAALEQELADDRKRLASALERAEADRKRLEEERLRALEPKPKAPPPVQASAKPRPKPVEIQPAVREPAPPLQPPPVEIVKPEPAKPEPVKAEPVKLEPVKPEPVRAPAPVVDALTSADLAYARGSYGDAIALLKPLAEHSNAKALVRLGRLYLDGQGVERNEAEALRLFRKAAEQGDNEARLRLGDMYASGRGVPQNNFQAYIWYGAAARAGNPAAKVSQERVGATMQPMEIRQATRLIDALAPATKEP